MPKVDEIDELVWLMEEERPLDLAEPPMDLPEELMDEDDAEQLMYDMYDFAVAVTWKTKSKELHIQAEAMCRRLEKLLAWNRLH